jgi:hypothetical protein
MVSNSRTERPAECRNEPALLGLQHCPVVARTQSRLGNAAVLTYRQAQWRLHANIEHAVARGIRVPAFDCGYRSPTGRWHEANESEEASPQVGIRLICSSRHTASTFQPVLVSRNCALTLLT